jgi:hypothetical protein
MEFVAFGWWIGIAVVALVVVCLAVPALRARIFGRLRTRGRASPSPVAQGRLEVLDTTIVDAERRLLLVRCDRIEHLIMIGGPSDLVVENDVRKVRQPNSGQTKPAAEPHQHAAAAGPTERTGSSARAAQQPAPQPRTSLASMPPVSSQPAGTGDAMASSRGGARTEEQPRMPAQRSHSAEPQPGRRESTVQPRGLQAQPALVGANRSAEARRGQGPSSGNGRDGDGSARMPAADVPWPQPDSLESEIVQALNVDPRLERNAAPSSPREPAARKQTDSSTTLGDLAERLEEALAREVQSASKGSRRTDAGSGAEQGPDSRTAESRKRQEPKERNEPRERLERPERTMSAAPEAETRRDQPRDQHSERREEAPVISLNARRREAADPLEDEMARLLGELTGDTKGR